MDTLTPITNKDRNFYRDGKNNGFLGDYVETISGVGYKGRIYGCHWWCPEDDSWLARQNFLGNNPMRWKHCRWVSILVHGGGAIVVPEQFVQVVDPFNLNNDSKEMYFR